MDHKKKTLLKVTIGDYNATEEIFNILMSDYVEKRRVFIFKHALEAVKDVSL